MTADTEVTYEFGVTKGKQGKEVPPIYIGGRAHLPFQVHTEYTDLDGTCIKRVFTRAIPVTRNRQTVEKSMSVS